MPLQPFYAFGDSSQVQYITGYTISLTEHYIAKLGELTASLQAPVITPVFPNGPTAPAISVDPLPATQQIIWSAPAVPTPFFGTLNIDSLLPAPFDVDPPTMVFPTAPTPFAGAVPASPPIDLNFTYPSLDVSLPAPPSLFSLQTYNFNGVTMPTIDQTLPVLTAIAPSIREYVPGAFYTSGLLTSLRASLQDRIDNGGTGLKPEVEQAIWDRAREREARGMADAFVAIDQMETLGYAFPPGAFLDARVKIQTEFGYTTAGLSRDIAIEQAKLEQTNVIEALKTATQLESQLITYTNQVEQRVFESSKYATEAGIAIYNAQVQAYAAYIEAYKTKVAIYEAQVRGALAEVEVYKTEIQAEEIKAQVNTALVTQYKVQVEAALATIEVFKAEIQAIQTKAEVEKIKVEVFGEQVKAYTAQINTYTAQVEGFRAAIQGQTALQEVYKSQVDAYSALVGAQAKTIQAKIEEFKGNIDAKTLEYEGLKALVAAEASHAQAIASSNTSVAQLYNAQTSGKSAYNETLTKQWNVALDQAERVAEVGIAAAKSNAELFMTTRSLALDAAKVGAQVNAQLGAASLSAINWSTSQTFGHNEAVSDSVSNSTSASVSSVSSNSNSFSTNYNYNV